MDRKICKQSISTGEYLNSERRISCDRQKKNETPEPKTSRKIQIFKVANIMMMAKLCMQQS